MTAVGVGAFAIIAALVPADRTPPEQTRLRDDLKVLARPAVLLGLATTVLSWIGVFAAFTYIAPLLTRVAGFDERYVSPILLVFGAGLVAGNILGGRLADRSLMPSVLWTLAALAAAPAPEATSLTFLMSLPATFSALSMAAPTTIAVPCWSSWKTGIFMRSRSLRST